jgi:anti-sigma B factor antagonist
MGDLVLSGELDVADVPALLSTLDALTQHGDRRVHVDLDDVTFVDAAVLGALVRTSNCLHEAGGSLVVTCRRGQPRRLFELARLEHLLAPAECP